MERFSRSMSSREKPHPSGMRDLRSRSTSDFNNAQIRDPDFKASPSKKNFNGDSELQRKKRVAGYKAYAVQGKLKKTLKKSVRWIKGVVHW